MKKHLDIGMVTIDRVRCAWNKRISKQETDLLLDDKIDIVFNFAREEWTALFEQWVCGIKDERISVHEKYPADWKQAFKERWFPLWLLKWFPVRYTHIDIEEPRFKAVCPHVGFPEVNRHYQFLHEEKLRQQGYVFPEPIKPLEEADLGFKPTKKKPFDDSMRHKRKETLEDHEA